MRKLLSPLVDLIYATAHWLNCKANELTFWIKD